MQKLQYPMKDRNHFLTPQNATPAGYLTVHIPHPRSQHHSNSSQHKYTTSPFRNSIHFLQHQNLIKYGHSRHITQEISSSKSEDEQTNLIAPKHKRELTNITNIKYIKNMDTNSGELLEGNKIIINQSKFMKENLNSKQNQSNHHHPKHIRSDSAAIKPIHPNNNHNTLQQLQNNSPNTHFTNSINRTNQIQNEKCRFRILSSDNKNNHQFINERFKLQFKNHNHPLKIKTDSSWTKSFIKKQSRLGNHARFLLPLHQPKQQKNSQQIYKIQKKQKSSLNHKNNKKKHIRHNTQISTSTQKQPQTNHFQKKQLIQLKNNPKNLSPNKKQGVFTKPNQHVHFDIMKIQQQCSVIYENDSQVQICLKTLQKTKLEMNQNFQKSVNISFLDHQAELQTNTQMHTPRTPIKQNNKLSSEYRKGKFLGKGYFGQVYLGLHIPTGVICALKYLDLKRLVKEDMLQSIRRQIQCQILLSHPNICKIYQYYIDQQAGSLVLVIELVEGEQLYKIMKNKRRMNEQQTADIIFQVASALQYMHKKHIIHRDIKPQNIMVTNGIAKICDFGWAVITTGSRKTICGTPLYSSPEIVLGKQYDKKSDLWALGVLTYQMLIGLAPFKVYGEHQLIKIAEDQLKFPQYVDLSSKAKDFIIRLLNKNPQQRMDIFEILDHPFIRRRKRALQRVSLTYPDFLKVLFQ